MFKVVARSWGGWTEIWRSKRLCVKILRFDARSHISRQRHARRCEWWIVLSGTGLLWPGEREVEMFDMIFIRKNEWHQFHAFIPTKILEIQFGSSVTEDDIERI